MVLREEGTVPGPEGGDAGHRRGARFLVPGLDDPPDVELDALCPQPVRDELIDGDLQLHSWLTEHQLPRR